MTCEVGSFDAPDGWTALDGVGAAERPAIPDGSRETFRRSVVVCADTLPEGLDAAGYFALQQASIPHTIPGCSVVDASPADADGGAWTLALQIDAPEADALAQWMAFLVRGRRVAVITATALDAHAGDAVDIFEEAVASFEFSGAGA